MAIAPVNPGRDARPKLPRELQGKAKVATAYRKAFKALDVWEERCRTIRAQAKEAAAAVEDLRAGAARADRGAAGLRPGRSAGRRSQSKPLTFQDFRVPTCPVPQPFFMETIMPGNALRSSHAPAEIDGLPEEFERDVLTWVRNWPRVEQAWDMFAETAAEYLRVNRELNHKAGRKGNDRSLDRKQREALADLLKRTVAVQDFLTRRLS